MKKGFIILFIGIFGITLTVCKSRIEQLGKDDGQHCELAYSDEFEKAYNIISGGWVEQTGKKYIKIYEGQGVYYINTSEKIPGRSFSQSDFDIYGMKMEEDEFDIYEGQYMITVDCNADEMQCKYTFSYDEEKDLLYEGNLIYQPEDKSRVYTDDDIVKKYFPKLEGLEFVCWECQQLGEENARTPGSTDYAYRGYIVLEGGKLSQLDGEYEWSEIEFSPSSEFIDMSEYQDYTWYYSDEFAHQIMSETISGKIYSNGEILWFEIFTC